MKYKTILVHADESVHAATHPALAAQLALQHDARLVGVALTGAALPFLRRAERITVAVFRPADEPAADPALLPYLKRHGIEALLQEEFPGLAGGEPLLSLAADQVADLLVTGGYGRARLSELLLGGLTRTVPASMTVPVLMAH